MLSASVAFAATDDNATVGEVNNEIAIDENVLTIADDSSVLQNETPAGSPVVTNDTFFNYFDEYGMLNTTSDELIFEGDFSGINVSTITINKAIKFTGNNATFSGVTFTIYSDNVTIDGFTLSQDKDITLILVDRSSNVVISNNVIDFKALEGYDSYAIWAYYVDNLKLINNTISYVGNTDGTKNNNAVRVEGDSEKKASNILVDGNVFDITIPSSAVYYDDMTWNAYPYTDGLTFISCENLTINENEISLDYNNVTGGADTIHVIAVGSSNFDDSYQCTFTCKNVVVANNTINAEGYNFIYGIYVCADNFVIDNNELEISADYHYANGIIIDGPSNGGVVSDNVIDVEAPNLAFGVYSYPYMGAAENIIIDGNEIAANAYASCGMEIVENNPTISNNFMDIKGNHTTGIVANMVDNGTISGNEIYSSGSNVGTTPTGDGMLHLESVGISVKGDTLILENDVESSSIGVNLIMGGEFNLVNNTIYVRAYGDTDNYAVYAADGIDALVATGNDIEFLGYTNGTIISNAFLVNGVDNAVIKDNTFDLTLVSAHVDWPEIPEGSWNYVRTPYSEGIVIKNSEGVVFEGNDVTVNHANYTVGSDDTIYAVDLIDSPNSVISNNSIVATGNKYMHAIIIASPDFTVENNYVTSISDDYAAYAINPESGSSGTVKNNTFVAIAPDVTYTIYSSAWDANRVNVDYIANQIYCNAYCAYAFNIGGANENIINNTIISEGNYSVAVYSQSVNNNIAGNTIRTLATGEGNKTVPTTTNEIEAIKLIGATAVISDNYIESTGDFAIDLGSSDSTVANNYIAAKKAVGVAAIVNAGSGAVITNNTHRFKNCFICCGPLHIL